MPGSLRRSRISDERRRRLVKLCRALPEVEVEVAQSHLSFRVRKKIFGYYLFDHHGDGVVSFCCKAAPGEQSRLVEESPRRFFVPAYLGPKGWVGVRLDRASVSWPEMAHLARVAYRLTAPPNLASQLD